MREVEAELIQEMGSDPIELFRMDVAAHATALLGPRIMSLCSAFGVVAEVERPSDAIRVIVCRSFATDADRELFESGARSEEHTSELQSLMSSSYAVFCLKKKKV